MDVSMIMGQVLKLSEQVTESLQAQLKTETFNNPEKMLNIQFSMQQYSFYLGCTSGILKTARDLVSSIISKI